MKTEDIKNLTSAVTADVKTAFYDYTFYLEEGNGELTLRIRPITTKQRKVTLEFVCENGGVDTLIAEITRAIGIIKSNIK